MMAIRGRFGDGVAVPSLFRSTLMQKFLPIEGTYTPTLY